jgi:hypothetical protein
MKRIADLSEQSLDEDQITAQIREEFVNGQPLQDNEFNNRGDEIHFSLPLKWLFLIVIIILAILVWYLV